MSEYVFRDAPGFGCDMSEPMFEGNGETAGEFYARENDDHYGTLHEEIVRCRDCKHCYEDVRDTSIGQIRVLTCDSEQWSTSSLMPSHTVKGDGFCAWGERKADE